MYDQTAYISSLNTYVEENMAILYAAEHLAFAQLGMKAKKMWEQRSVEAIIKEMNQSHNCSIVHPVLPNKINPQVKTIALGYLVYLKRNETVLSKDRDVSMADHKGFIS